ncbi:LamG-like jellyroll fold domain-containing protein [Vulgatibacter incomptus]|nr:LamG-like jellyroll fold domain-containing protein [Vulgatibacter incomptus]
MRALVLLAFAGASCGRDPASTNAYPRNDELGATSRALPGDPTPLLALTWDLAGVVASTPATPVFRQALDGAEPWPSAINPSDYQDSVPVDTAVARFREAGKYNGPRSGLLNISPICTASTFTVRAAVLVSNQSGRRPILRGENYSIAVVNKKIEASIWAAGQWWTTTSGENFIPTGQWLRVELTHDESTVSLNINEIEVSSVPAPPSNPECQMVVIGTGPLEHDGFPEERAIKQERPFVGGIGNVEIFSPSISAVKPAMEVVAGPDGIEETMGRSVTTSGKPPVVPGPLTHSSGFYFDGETSVKIYDETGKIFDGEALTASLWVYPIGFQKAATVFESPVLTIQLVEGRARVTAFGSRFETSIGAVPENAWTELTVTHTAKGLALFANGSRVLDGGVAFRPFSDKSEITIAAASDGTERLKGFVFEPRIWKMVRVPKRPLSTVDVKDGQIKDLGAIPRIWNASLGASGIAPSVAPDGTSISMGDGALFTGTPIPRNDIAYTIAIRFAPKASSTEHEEEDRRVQLWSDRRLKLALDGRSPELEIRRNRMSSDIPTPGGDIHEIRVVFDGEHVETFVNGEYDSSLAVFSELDNTVDAEIRAECSGGRLLSVNYWNEAVRPVSPVQEFRALLAGPHSEDGSGRGMNGSWAPQAPRIPDKAEELATAVPGLDPSEFIEDFWYLRAKVIEDFTSMAWNNYTARNGRIVIGGTSKMTQDILDDSRTWQTPFEMGEGLRRASAQIGEFYWRMENSFGQAVDHAWSYDSWYSDPNGDIWRDHFVEIGGRIEDLPELSTDGPNNQALPNIAALRSWDDYLRHLILTHQVRLKAHQQFHALNAIGRAVQGDLDVSNKKFPEAAEHYQQSIHALSWANGVEGSLKDAYLDLSMNLDSETVAFLELADIDEVLEGLSDLVPFSLNAALRTVAEEIRKDEKTTEAVNAVARVTDGASDGADRAIAAWVAAASAHLEAANWKFRIQNLDGSVESCGKVFRRRFGRAAWDGSSPLQTPDELSIDVLNVRVRALSLLDAIEDGTTPFGYSSSYLPFTRSNSSLYQSAKEAVDALKETIELYNQYTDAQGRAEDRRRAIADERAKQSQERNSRAQDITAAKDELDIRLKSYSKALQARKNVYDNAVWAGVSEGANIVIDVVKPWTDMKSCAADCTPMKEIIRAVGPLGAVYSGALKLWDVLNGRSKAMKDADAAVEAAAALVREARKRVETSISQYRTAETRFRVLDDRLNMTSLPDSELSTGWWLQRRLEMKQNADWWSNQAFRRVWLYQQSAEKITDRGFLPLWWGGGPPRGTCMITDYLLDWLKEGDQLEELLSCLHDHYDVAIQQIKDDGPADKVFSIKKNVDSVRWGYFKQSLARGEKPRIQFDLSLEDVERVFKYPHVMFSEVGVELITHAAPGGSDSSDYVYVDLTAEPVSYVRIEDSLDRYSDGFPIVESEEWMQAPPPGFKVKAKVQSEGPLTRRLHLQSNDRVVWSSPASNATLDGSSSFAASGLARSWSVELDFPDEKFNFDELDDVHLVFYNLGQEINDGFKRAVEAEVGRGSGSVVLAFGPAAAEGTGFPVQEISSSILPSTSGNLKKIRRMQVLIVPDREVQLAASPITIKFIDDGTAVNGFAAPAPDGSLSLFVDQSGLPPDTSVLNHFEVDLPSDVASRVANVLLGVEF